jgi:hypothetical protein
MGARFFRKVHVMRSWLLSPRLQFVACFSVPLFLLGLLCSSPWQGLASESRNAACTAQVNGNVGMEDYGAREDNTASTLGEEPADVPIITSFYVENLCGNIWTFSGRVMSPWPSTCIITLGGFPAVQGKTIQCLDDGTFLLTMDIGCCCSGMVTAIATDGMGNVSAQAANYVN